MGWEQVMTKEIVEIHSVELSQEVKEICNNIIDDAAIGRFYKEVLKIGEDGRIYSEEPIWNSEHGFNTPEMENVYTEIRDKINEDLNSVLDEISEKDGDDEYYFSPMAEIIMRKLGR